MGFSTTSPHLSLSCALLLNAQPARRLQQPLLTHTRPTTLSALPGLVSKSHANPTSPTT